MKGDNMKVKEKKINIFNTRMKARLWWDSLNDDMKKTMVHNPSVNHSDTFVGEKVHLLVNKSSVIKEKFFINWLEWEQGK